MEEMFFDYEISVLQFKKCPFKPLCSGIKNISKWELHLKCMRKNELDLHKYAIGKNGKTFKNMYEIKWWFTSYTYHFGLYKERREFQCSDAFKQ